MNFPAKRRRQQRLAVVWLTVLGFIAPMLSASSARAEGDLKNDARLETYAKPVALDASPAPYYMLLGALAVLIFAGLFKDAKRSYLK